MRNEARGLFDIEIDQLRQAMHDPYDDYEDKQVAYDSEKYALWLNDMDEEYERMYRAEFEAMKNNK